MKLPRLPPLKVIDAAAHEEPGSIRWLPAFEVLAWCASLSTLLFLKASGLQMGWKVLAYTTPDIAAALGVKILLLGVPLHLVYRLVTRRSLKSYLRVLITPRWWLLTLRAWAACVAVFSAYLWLKVYIPVINFSLWDAELWKLDRILHFGLQPNLVVIAWLEDTLAAGWIDWWYGMWLNSTMMGACFLVAFAGSPFRRRFLFSFSATWILGCWWYVAFPALGPVYVYPDVTAGVRDSFPVAADLQRALGENYRILLAARRGGSLRINPAFGIAALPSLHVGLHWLLTAWIRRVAPWLFVPCVAGTLLTFIGSIATGWHYAVDAYAGILLAHLCYRAALLTERDGAPETP